MKQPEGFTTIKGIVYFVELTMLVFNLLRRCVLSSE